MLNPVYRFVVGGCLAFAVSACIVPRATIPEGDDGRYFLELRAGDHIRVVTTRRARYSMEIVEIGPKELVGVTLRPATHETSPKGQRVSVPYEELALLEVRRFSPLTTAGTVLAVAMIGALVAATEIGPGLPSDAPSP